MVKNKSFSILYLVTCFSQYSWASTVPAPVLGPGDRAGNKADELSAPVDLSYLEKA